MKLINKFKFAKVTLEKNFEKFVLYIVALETLKPAIHSF